MRLLPRLVIALAACLLVAAVSPVPAQAECVLYGIELSPESGAPGTEVTVHGYEFNADMPIDLYYDDVLVSEGTETDNKGEFDITFIVPEGCTGHYWVLAEVGSSLGPVTADTQFAVKPGLILSPERGPVGTNVTVQGRGFVENEGGIELLYYRYDGYKTIERNITANSKGSWDRSFSIPASSRGEHKLDAQGIESKLYEVQDAIFRVTAEITIDKTSGIVGDAITMSGSRFATNENGITILFDDQAVVTDIEANSEGEWEEGFDVPEMPAGEHSVTAEGEHTSKEDVGGLSFEVQPDIVLSPAEGHVGTNVTVVGHGFAASTGVNISYNSGLVATAETNDLGSFDVSFIAPASKHGAHKITAGYGTGNAANTIFTMESDPPPTPTLISPSNGSRMGFMGEVAPTFEWSEVSDDSGIAYYRLQIATSADVTASGEFVDPLVSVTNLDGTSYTVTQALPYGTYYWIAQAVDGAENESGWTAPRSFRIGFLPLWGLIAAIAGAVVLLALLIRALVVRRTVYYDRW
jgi:hypothetical protein